MSAIDFNEKLELFPGIYNEGKQIDANIYKILQVIVEEINELSNVFNDIADQVDINNNVGEQLNLLGADYGLQRGGKNDIDFRALIFSRISNFADGNTVNSVINYFSFFTPLSGILVTELFIETLGFILDGTEILDGTQPLRGAGFRRERGFDVATDPLTPELEASLLEALDILKSGGILATINGLP